MDNATNTAADNRKPWPQRFGTLESLQVKTGQRGRYGIAVIDCKAFKQTAFVFNEMALEKLIAAGEGAQVWTKGPIEAAQRKNAEGKAYSEDVYKVVYAKDITKGDEAEAQPEAAEDDTPAEPQDLTAVKGVGAKVAEALTTAGISTYAALANASDDALEAAGKGYAARAANGDWKAQAAALHDTDGASAKTDAEIDAELPI